MALSDNRRLYDIAVRKAAFLEGVKLNQIGELNAVLFDLSEELKKVLGRVRYRTLDGLSKAALNRLILELREVQGEIYSKYTEGLIEQLQEFSKVDAAVARIVFGTAKVEEDDEDEEEPMDEETAIAVIEATNDNETLIPLFGLLGATSNERIWSAAVNAPMPANGMYIVPFIKGFGVSAQANVENIIRQAYANRLTIEQVLELITGRTAQGVGGAIQRIESQGAAVILTATQHVDSIVNAGVASALFGRYQWISVMDSRTTVICRGRNRRIYEYGRGPLPPAHIRCRSTVVPIVGNNPEIDDETFYTWLSTQPDEVQRQVLTRKGRVLLDAGELTADDLQRYETDRPLTFAEFRRLVNLILKRV